MAMGLSESPVASDEGRSEALGEGDVNSVGDSVSPSQLTGALYERLCRPTPDRQALVVGNSNESFVIADQLANDRSTYRTDDLDVEVGRGILGSERVLLLTDLIAAETAYVLESFYAAPRNQVAQAMRSLVAFDSIVCVDPALLLRAIEIYKTERIDFAEAYQVACAESTGVGKVASFDRSIDRIDTIERIESPR